MHQCNIAGKASGCKNTCHPPRMHHPGGQLLGQPWLLLALAIYAGNLALAFFVQRPNLRRLIGVRAAADDKVWQARARRQRYVSYAMAALVGTIGFLMSTKPALW